MMNLLEDVLSLRTAMPFGPIALGAFSVAGISALALLVAALFAWRRGATRATRAFAALTFGTFALGAFAASRVLANAHRAIVHPKPVPPFVKVNLARSMALGDILGTWCTLGCALLLGCALSGAALLLLARRAGMRRTSAMAAALVCALGLVTGVGILYRYEVESLACHPHRDFDMAARTACIHEGLEDARGASSNVRRVLVALAMLGSGLLAVVSRRKTTEPDARDPEAALPIGAAVFAFGLAAWIGARGMAYDAAHPLAPPSAAEESCPDGMAPPAASLPPAGSCDASSDVPYVIVDAEGLRIDGMRAANVAELTKILQNKRELSWQILQRDPANPLVMIAAPAETAMATLVPVIAAVQNGFGGAVAVVGVHPERRVSTATLGEITRERRCCNTHLRIDPNGAPLSRYATWGELARAAHEGAFFHLDP